MIMKKKSWRKRPDEPVSGIAVYMAFALFVCLMFCPSCRDNKPLQEERLREEELYEPLENPPKSKFDSVQGNYYLRA